MKKITQTFFFSLLTVLTLTSCTKKYYTCEVASDQDPRWPLDIIAQWQQNSVNFDLQITSNIDQLAIDLATPSEDSLSAISSDGNNGTLKYLQFNSEDQNIILAQNQTIGGISYPKHELVIIYNEVADSGAAVYSFIFDESSDTVDYSGFINFSFNELEYLLSITNQTLYNADSSIWVSLNGSINIQTQMLVSDNPISVPIQFQQTATTIILNHSGEYFRLTDDGSGVPDEAQGTWEVIDTTLNIITVIETYEDWESGETVTDTLDISYTLDSDILSFSQIKNPCSGFDDEAECFEQYELNFGLSENSIIDLSMISTIAYTRILSKNRELINSRPTYWFNNNKYFRDNFLNN